jgi:ferric-dicitrate binding protein FerR (iron transport regulator)
MIESLLHKFREGTCSEAEIAQLHQYFQTNNLEELESLLEKDWLESASQPLPEAVSTRMWERLESAITHETRVVPMGSRFNRTAWWAAAASILFLLSAAGWWKWQGQVQQAGTSPWVSYATGLGDQDTVNLPDGSQVILNHASSVYFPRQFNETRREVHLTGEAYFSVVRDTLRPFIVTSKGISTQVLGTTFYVSGYEGSQVTVTLATGKVKVFDQKGNEALLLPGQQVIADSLTDRKWQTTVVDLEGVSAWKSGLLVYADVPLEKLAPTLERWYQVRIEFRDQGARKASISGKPTGQSLWDLLESYRFIAGINYELGDDGVIYLYSGK